MEQLLHIYDNALFQTPFFGWLLLMLHVFLFITRKHACVSVTKLSEDDIHLLLLE